jgi:hypothetical protein
MSGYCNGASRLAHAVSIIGVGSMDVSIMKSCLHGGILEKGTETRG